MGRAHLRPRAFRRRPEQLARRREGRLAPTLVLALVRSAEEEEEKVAAADGRRSAAGKVTEWCLRRTSKVRVRFPRPAKRGEGKGEGHGGESPTCRALDARLADSLVSAIKLQMASADFQAGDSLKVIRVAG